MGKIIKGNVDSGADVAGGNSLSNRRDSTQSASRLKTLNNVKSISNGGGSFISGIG